LGRSLWARIAICTVLSFTLFGATDIESRPDEAINRDAYRRDQIARGARKIPLLAQLAYRDALVSLEDGNRNRAEKHLHQALRFDPHYTDAYWTLARLKFMQLDIEAPIYLSQALQSLWWSFRNQKLLALNGAATIAFVLMTLNLVVCFAFSLRYLPYVAHKLREFLKRRFNAVLPGIAAYAILLTPVVLLPGTLISLGYLMILCWLFMYRREKILVTVIVAPLMVAGLFDTHVRLAATLADPKSLTSLVARTNVAGSDSHLIHAIERVQTPELEAEKNLALGLQHLKASRFDEASDHLFKAISLKPDDTMGYMNLGSLHFLLGEHEKALQGYRKSESIDATDPVCQFNLAQVYIKTLLMKKASRSLQSAAAYGIESEKSLYSMDTLEASPVLFKHFSKKDLWRIALAEARSFDEQRIDFPLSGKQRKTGAWILVAIFIAALILARSIDPSKLAFQCSNCGKITCDGCCNQDRDMSLCAECAKTIESVSSEKVVDALLRQKRQAVLVRRKKSERFTSIMLPGVREIYHGRILRGVFVAGLFSFSLVCLVTKGAFFRDPLALVNQPPLWKTILPVSGIIAAYVMSAFSKPRYRFRSQRHRSTAHGPTEPKNARAA
jgi:tetratricopeptide (TPR) repeat protein